MKKYEKFSKQEIINIITKSYSYKEALQKLGYVDNIPNRSMLRALAQQYELDLYHFVSNQTNNLMGQRFGRLVVISKVASKGQGARWLCQCDCGNTTEVDSNHLTRREIQSCGCLQKEKVLKLNQTKLLNLVGQRFGKLIVLERAENIGEQPAWICKCDCGTITHPITGGNLRSGATKSCGCLVSKGEAKIREIFNTYNINYQTQITFTDCTSDKNVPLRFDFGVYDNNNKLLYLIEYQGIQHYYEVTWTHDSLAARQKRDYIKQKYCNEHNIPLIIIPYTKFPTLNIKDLTIKGVN